MIIVVYQVVYKLNLHCSSIKTSCHTLTYIISYMLLLVVLLCLQMLRKHTSSIMQPPLAVYMQYRCIVCIYLCSIRSNIPPVCHTIVSVTYDIKYNTEQQSSLYLYQYPLQQMSYQPVRNNWKYHCLYWWNGLLVNQCW